MSTPSLPHRLVARSRALLPVAFILFILSASGCSTVYSPFAALPAAPTAGGHGALSATVNILPETRPEGNFGEVVAPGGELLARYAFTDHVSLQARVWSRLDESLAINGTSIDGLYVFGDSSSAEGIRYGIQARAVMMFSGQELAARAALVTGVAWLPELFGIRPYVGLGAGLGDYIGSYGGEEGNRWGYALINNVGGNVSLFGDFSANVELVQMVQVNRYDHTIQAIGMLPSVSLVWSF